VTWDLSICLVKPVISVFDLEIAFRTVTQGLDLSVVKISRIIRSMYDKINNVYLF
jgi:hypothetical protein